MAKAIKLFYLLLGDQAINTHKAHAQPNHGGEHANNVSDSASSDYVDTDTDFDNDESADSQKGVIERGHR